MTLLADPDSETKGRLPAARRGRWVLRAVTGQRAGLAVVVVVLIIVFGTLRPTFYDSRLVVFPLLRDIATLTVVGLAQLAVLSIGHMNLAVGRMAAFGAMVAGFSYQVLGLGLVSGLVLGLLAGAAVGALAGVIITSTGVNSFVVTLGLDFALLGLVTLVYGQFTTLAAFTVKPPGMEALRSYSLGDLCIGDLCGSPAVPQLLLLTVVALAGVGYLFARARTGREMLLTGSNATAAELSGIPTKRRVIGAHTLSGLLSGLAGFMLAVTAGSFTAGIGSAFLIPSFLGPVLGGTALTGGAVSVVGTFLGISLTQVIQQGLSMLGVGLESLNIYLGLILVLALSAVRIRQLFTRRRKSS